jgi:NAD(P)-dependent dehydrogenase (short-subunit alcohol dehydrogenase family)
LTIRFGEEHLRLFRDASRDFNPLHLSEDYARRTPYGERVVYGMLGFAACLGKMRPPEGRVPTKVRIDFKGPQVLGVDYRLDVKQDASGNVKAALMDGSAALLQIRLELREGTPETAILPDEPSAPRSEARRIGQNELKKGLAEEGCYSPGREAYLRLAEYLGVDRSRWGDGILLLGLCSSYLTGMELPGESAAYVGLRADLQEARIEGPWAFEIRLEEYDERYGVAQSQFRLGTFARGEITAIARPDGVKAAPIGPAGVRPEQPLAGKTALIIGASRGLGAAMTLEVAAQGGTAIAVYARSAEEAAALVTTSAGLPGRVIPEQGDASDPRWCAQLRERLRAEGKSVDLLILSAAPALQPLRLEETYYERIASYVEKGFALVAAPMASFLEMVSAAAGTVLLISSAAVDDPPATWPHYVALKAAAEALVRTAAVSHPRVCFRIARPGKILTDLINTPMGRVDAEDPGVAARRILVQSGGAGTKGQIVYCG